MQKSNVPVASLSLRILGRPEIKTSSNFQALPAFKPLFLLAHKSNLRLIRCSLSHHNTLKIKGWVLSSLLLAQPLKRQLLLQTSWPPIPL